ncbi:hypothetical protein D3C71_1534940 [compost metagenome]
MMRIRWDKEMRNELISLWERKHPNEKVSVFVTRMKKMPDISSVIRNVPNASIQSQYSDLFGKNKRNISFQKVNSDEVKVSYSSNDNEFSKNDIAEVAKTIVILNNKIISQNEIILAQNEQLIKLIKQ